MDVVVVIALVYGIGILISAVGVFRYRSRIKKSNLSNTNIRVENKGKPVSGGIKHLKIICK